MKVKRLMTFAIAMVFTSMSLSSGITKAEPKTRNNQLINSYTQYKNPFKGDYEESELLDKNLQLNKLELKPAAIKKDVNTKTSELVSIIVEFNSLPTIVAKKSSAKKMLFSIDRDVQSDHANFVEFLSKKPSTFSLEPVENTNPNSNKQDLSQYKIENSYYNTFNGVSMKIKGTDIPKLLECSSVKAIWSDYSVKLELPENNKSTDNNKLRTNNEITPFMFDSVPLIGAEELHKEGINGAGIKVGVLDTGIDYNHPDLKDNYKGGYDFIDKDEDPMETTYEEWLNSGAPEDFFGSTYYTSHGTHVSGTIAANGKNIATDLAVTGIAPEAELYMYRVLGPYGMGDESTIIAGIEKAVEDGMDIINLSLGADLNEPLYPLSVACNNSMLAGVTTVVANGNSGPVSYTVGSPASADLPISVGASTTSLSVSQYEIKAGDKSFKGSLFIRGFDNAFKDIASRKEYGIYDCKFALDSTEFPEEVKENIALISRGEITFVEKLKAAKEAGAVAVIIYNNEPGNIPFYLGEMDLLPAISISDEDGQALLQVANSENNKISLTITGEEKTEGDVLSDFSSRGPSGNGNIKPDIVAPGDQIFSTYPEYINDPQAGENYSKAYARISGTSMASPHVAGIAALILQQNKDYTPFDIKSVIMNTAENLKYDYAINESGSGRVNAYEAVHSSMKFVVKDSTINLDDYLEPVEIDNLTGGISYGYKIISDTDVKEEINIEFENEGAEDKNFKIEVKFHDENVGAKNAITNNVKLDIVNSIAIKAGENKEIATSLLIPKGAEAGKYEGMIYITNVSDESENYRIPFYVNYIEPAILVADLSNKVVSNDIELMDFFQAPGATGYLATNMQFDKLSIYYRSFDTDEVVGFRGELDGTGALPEFVYELPNIIDPNALYYPVKAGKIEPGLRKLKDGKYFIEYVFEGIGGKTLSQKVPFIIDNQNAKLTIDNLKPGYNEITDAMYSTEVIDGEEQRVIRVTGKIEDNSIEILKSMGIEVDGSSLLLGAYYNDMPLYYQNIEPDGSFSFAIKEADIIANGGALEFTPIGMDGGTSKNYKAATVYNLINKDVAFISTKVDKTILKEKDKVNTTLSVNNLSAGSKFEMVFNIPQGFELNSYKLNPNFQKYLETNKLKATVKDKLINNFGVMELTIDVEIVDEKGNLANISGNFEVLDFETSLINDDNIMAYYEVPVISLFTNIVDNADNYIQTAFNPISDVVKVEVDSSAVQAIVPLMGLFSSMDETLPEKYKKFLWIEDSKGNKYPLDYNKNYGVFYVNNLPVTTEEMKLVADAPGHFKREAYFTPSRVVGGNNVGKTTFISVDNFGNMIFSGDVNKDNVIDVLDLLEIEKVYNKNKDVIGEYNPCDFNGDSLVDINDLDLFYFFAMAKNDAVDNAPEPRLEAPDGRTIEQILTELNYFIERPVDITLSEESKEIKVGESFTLTAKVLPETANNKEYQWMLLWDSDKVVSLNEKTGEVTGKIPGSALVAARTVDGGLVKFCEVIVNGDSSSYVPVESITLDKYDVSLEMGNTETIKATINPENATDKNLEWYSSASSVVTVVDGKLEAKSIGNAIVSVVNEATGVAKTLKVLVKEKEVIVDPEDPDDSDKDDNDNNNSGNNGGNNDNNNGTDSGKGQAPNIPKTGALVSSNTIVLFAVLIIFSGLLLYKKKDEKISS